MALTQLSIEYIPLCVEMKDDSGRLRVAMQRAAKEHPARTYRAPGSADGNAMRHVLEEVGNTDGYVALIEVHEAVGEIVLAFVHMLPLLRQNGSILKRPTINGFVWCDPDSLPTAMSLQVQRFLRRELLVDCRYPCLFLPKEWTASEYRRVRDAITGNRQDVSNARKMVESMVMNGLVTLTGCRISTATRPAPTYVASEPSEQELHGSPWRHMDSERPEETP